MRTVCVTAINTGGLEQAKGGKERRKAHRVSPYIVWVTSMVAVSVCVEKAAEWSGVSGTARSRGALGDWNRKDEKRD